MNSNLNVNKKHHPKIVFNYEVKWPMLEKQCDINIAQTIELAQEMVKLAHKAYEQREDPGCGVLYGILLDSGYRLLDIAQKEKQVHINKGWWNNSNKNNDSISKLNFKKKENNL